MPPRLCNIFPLPASHPLHQWAVEVLGTYLCNIFYFWFFTSPQNLMSGFNFCLYFPNFIWLFLPLTQFLLSFFFFFFFFFFLCFDFFFFFFFWLFNLFIEFELEIYCFFIPGNQFRTQNFYLFVLWPVFILLSLLL